MRSSGTVVPAVLASVVEEGESIGRDGSKSQSQPKNNCFPAHTRDADMLMLCSQWLGVASLLLLLNILNIIPKYTKEFWTFSVF